MCEWACVSILTNTIQLPKLTDFSFEFKFETFCGFAICIPRLLGKLLYLSTSKHVTIFVLRFFIRLLPLYLPLCFVTTWLVRFVIHYLQVLSRHWRLVSVTEVIFPFLSLLFGCKVCHLLLCMITKSKCSTKFTMLWVKSTACWHWHLRWMETILSSCLVKLSCICSFVMLVCRLCPNRVLLIECWHVCLHYRRHGVWCALGRYWHYELIERWCWLCMHISSCWLPHSFDMFKRCFWMDILILILIKSRCLWFRNAPYRALCQLIIVTIP